MLSLINQLRGFILLSASLLQLLSCFQSAAADTADSKSYDCDSDGYCTNDNSVGLMIGGFVLFIVIFCVIPSLLCFFCAWCCFRGRSKGEVYGPSAVVMAVPQQAQVSGVTLAYYTQPNGYPGPPAYEQGPPPPQGPTKWPAMPQPNSNGIN